MPFQAGELVHLGAEAEVWDGTWFGKKAIRKQRRNRSWRHPDLDYQLGVRRLISECRIMLKLSNNQFPVPHLYDVDVEGQRMVMECIEGTPLIHILNSVESLNGSIRDLLFETGRMIRSLHRFAITHGDLSTNNMLVRNKSIVFIDFGLAAIEYEVERFGIDLHVLDEILNASHPHLNEAMEDVIKGYLSYDAEHGDEVELDGGKVPTAREVIDRLDEIRTRVRYHG
ncbi:MAG: KEOPS complex kinase/ATPase Bud32 [archaeon]|nr:KEOPS complex kinase/ATPase Bud32 [archaeon]